jgi:hypothetical protein
MSSISKIEALIYLVAYQNQGTLVDYLDPWIARWTKDFIMTGLSDSLHQRIIEAGFDEDELEDVVQNQPDIHDSSFGIERELLKEWTEWIISDNKRKDIVKAELEGYFYWHGKPWWEIPGDEDIPWYTEEGMPDTPQEALDWFKEVFGTSGDVFNVLP